MHISDRPPGCPMQRKQDCSLTVPGELPHLIKSTLLTSALQRGVNVEDMSPSCLAHCTCRTGVLSTIGSFGAWTGFPVGTVVEYAMDGGGKPVFAFSSLSSHTPDIKADPRCSLTVTAQDFQVMSRASRAFSRKSGRTLLHGIHGSPESTSSHPVLSEPQALDGCIYLCCRACRVGV